MPVPKIIGEASELDLSDPKGRFPICVVYVCIYACAEADLYETQLICHEVRKACEQRYKEDKEEIEITRKTIDKEGRRIASIIKKITKTCEYEIPEEFEDTSTARRSEEEKERRRNFEKDNQKKRKWTRYPEAACNQDWRH